MFSTFISARELSERLDDGSCVVVDCRYILGQPGAGEKAYREGHIPGARYADLEADLSGEVVAGETGRHPLPGEGDLVSTLRRLGICNGSQVVTYDNGSGQMAAARLWWLLKWAGHDAVAVLDGGLPAWAQNGLPLSSGTERDGRGTFEASFRHDLLVTTEEVEASVRQAGLVLVDSRGADRFRGENESIDPVGGHIPGAVSLPFAETVAAGGQSLCPEELLARFEDLVRYEATRVVFYCGSGVTAAQNVLAYASAGLGWPRLYAGSWSEWIADPSRPVETGASA